MKEDVINKKDVNEKEALARAQAIKTVEKSSKKIFEITVKECKNLKRLDPNFNPRLMQPFFSYDFYTFEYRSATA